MSIPNDHSAYTYIVGLQDLLLFISHRAYGVRIFSSNFFSVHFLRSLQTDPFNWDKQILVILIS